MEVLLLLPKRAGTRMHQVSLLLMPRLLLIRLKIASHRWWWMPLAFLLEAFDIVLEVDALRGAHVFQHPQHAWHHALEAAKVHVRSFVEPIENVIGVLLHLVLDVHLAAL